MIVKTKFSASFSMPFNIAGFMIASGIWRVLGHGSLAFAESTPFFADNNLGTNSLADFLVDGNRYQAVLTWHKWNECHFQIVG